MSLRTMHLHRSSLKSSHESCFQVLRKICEFIDFGDQSFLKVNVWLFSKYRHRAQPLSGVKLDVMADIEGFIAMVTTNTSDQLANHNMALCFNTGFLALTFLFSFLLVIFSSTEKISRSAETHLLHISHLKNRVDDISHPINCFRFFHFQLAQSSI